VPQLFDKLRRSLLDQGISHSGELFGISIPADNETPPMTISYFAGIESDISADDDFDELEVEPGNYFAVTYEGPMSTFDEAVVEIYGPLFSSTGHHVRDGKHLEIYGEAFNPDSDDSRMDVLIPIL
jgi:predicted transcriptional regulator YdeE